MNLQQLFEKQDKERRKHLEQEAVSFIVRCNTTEITEDSGDSYTNALEILKEIYVVNAESTISKIRQETLEAVREEIEKMQKRGAEDTCCYGHFCCNEVGFEEALDDLLKLLDTINK